MQDEIDIIDERTERAGLPLLLVTIFFLFEGMRFQSVGTFVLPCVGLMAMVPSLGLLPLRRTSVPQARCIYAWFLLASVVVAYVDYEVMIAHGVWFSDRPQDDPGKYMEMAQTEFEHVRINDPGFVILLQCFWKLQSQLGAPSFIGLVNCVMIISSVFAVCCLELSRFLSPSARYLPYLLIFNPLVIALNASLMRDILVGAVGWSAALCGIALLTHERRSPIVGIGLMVGFLSGCTAVYFLRTVSAAFFAGATVAIAASDGRRLKKMRALAMVGVGMSALVLLGEGLLARSVRHAGDADTVVESARDQGSVAAHVTGGLAGRIAVTVGGSIVYAFPFYRISLPVQVSEVIEGAGSLFAQLFTAFPVLVGLFSLVVRPRLLGCALLTLYLGWCIAAAVMLQNHQRYIVSHLLPVVCAIGAHGFDVLGCEINLRRRVYYVLLILLFVVAHMAIVLARQSL